MVINFIRRAAKVPDVSYSCRSTLNTVCSQLYGCISFNFIDSHCMNWQCNWSMNARTGVGHQRKWHMVSFKLEAHYISMSVATQIITTGTPKSFCISTSTLTSSTPPTGTSTCTLPTLQLGFKYETSYRALQSNLPFCQLSVRQWLMFWMAW